jgi:unsaturated chondroitin disaccharide hydrolase
MIQVDSGLMPAALSTATKQVFTAAAQTQKRFFRRWKEEEGAPVFTEGGRYTSRGWTEWTQGFVYGSALLTFDALGDEELLRRGTEGTRRQMAPHLTHFGVHDHGFNNVSTYGNLLRLINEDRIPAGDFEREYYALALQVSGAVQARRFVELPGDLGYVASFNGLHSLFVDTIRSVRVLMLAHALGMDYWGEQDRKEPLLSRALKHIETTLRYNLFSGGGRDIWDEPGRVVHEAIFNLESRSYRAPSTQQGYSPFSTWTRGQAWMILGVAEELEFVQGLDEKELAGCGLPYYPDGESLSARLIEAGRMAADHFIHTTPADGIPYWDTGAPGLSKMPGHESEPADPFNPYEPVDSSAAAISAQGLLRLGSVLRGRGETDEPYTAAGLTVASRLFGEPYLSADPAHEGLLLHAVYHRPNGWDAVPRGSSVPSGESCQWGDYHLLELALQISRMAEGGIPYTFYGGLPGRGGA